MSWAFKSFETQKSSHERPISNVILFLYRLQKKIFCSYYQCKVSDVEQSVPATKWPGNAKNNKKKIYNTFNTVRLIY